MKKLSVGLALAFSSFLLLGCAGQSANDTGAESAAENAEGDGGEDVAAERAAGGLFSIDDITSCGQIEAVVSQYIDGLVPDEDNDVDEWGAYCLWETPEDESDSATNRVVEVNLTTINADAVKPDPASVLAADGGSLIEDPWLTEIGGIGYSLRNGNDVPASIASTIWVPGVEAQVVGGVWTDVPPLDGPAAVAIVQALVAR